MSKKNNRNNQIKDLKAVKYISYMKAMEIVLVLAVLLMVFSIKTITGETLSQTITNNMSVVYGFIMAVGAVLTYLVLEQYLNDFNNLDNFESNRLRLIIVTFFNALLLNYISLILGLLGLVKIYKWKGYFSIKEAISKSKEEKQLGLNIILMVCYIVLVYLEYRVGKLVIG